MNRQNIFLGEVSSMYFPRMNNFWILDHRENPPTWNKPDEYYQWESMHLTQSMSSFYKITQSSISNLLTLTNHTNITQSGNGWGKLNSVAHMGQSYKNLIFVVLILITVSVSNHIEFLHRFFLFSRLKEMSILCFSSQLTVLIAWWLFTLGF